MYKFLLSCFFCLVSFVSFSAGHTVSITVNQNVTCFGGTNGSATAVVNGGVGPFSYSWNTVPAQTGATATNLSAGTYLCAVTDLSDNSVSSGSVTITQGANPNLIIQGPQTACVGQVITIAATGNGLVTYSWAGPNGYTATTSMITINAIPISSGTYTVTATNAQGCVFTATHLITISAFTINLSSVNPSCFGFSDGSIFVNVSGGSAPYIYSLSNGSNQTFPSFTNLSAGCYTVSVTDGVGCVQSNTVCLTSPPQLFSTFSFTQNASSCNSCDGSLTVVATGGTQPYSYSWSPSTSQFTSTVTNLCPGNYLATVTDANGCFANNQAIITGGSLSVSVVAAPDTCGQSTGTANAIVSGNSGPVTYSWMPGNLSTQAVAGLSQGTYTLAVSDSASCSFSQIVTIGNIGAPTPFATSNGANCGASNGTLVVAANGGTPAYVYSINGSAYSSNTTYPNLSSGTYTIQVMDQNGCVGTTTYLVPSFGLGGSITTTSVGCNNTPGSASFFPASGTAPYTYLWSNGSTTSSISVLNPGAYSVQVTDNTGCVGNFYTTVQSGANLYGSYTTLYYNCGINTGTVNAFNGTPPYSYSWSPGGYTTNSVSALAPGNYTVSITDANGCSGTAMVYVLNASYNTISGNVYGDVNGNCSFDAGDYALTNMSVQAVSSSGVTYYGYLNNSGNYTISVPNTAATYTLTPSPSYMANSSLYNFTCTNNVVAMTSNCDTANIDLGFTITPGQDLHVHTYCGIARPGFQMYNSIFYINAGTLPVSNVVVKYDLDPLLSFSGSTPPPSLVNGNHLEWNFASLNPNQQGVIQLNALVPTIQNGGALGTLISNSCSIEPLVNDVSVSDNTGTCSTNITGSYDPNYKEVNSESLQFQSTSTIDNSVQWMYYTVHFQNTGTDTAFTITVRDTVSSYLELSSIEMLSASHNFVQTINPGRELVMTFNNIYLPDSNRNEPLSHGYFQYRILTNSNLLPGNVIDNTAHIYFDFNLPIVTNTVQTPIVLIGIAETNSESTVKVAPNPVAKNSVLRLSFGTQKSQACAISIFDAQGRKVVSLATEDAMQTDISTSGLSSGVYFIRALGENGELYQARVVISD